MIFFLFLGEVERLLRDYPQNQELVRNLGSRYYQVVYPTQVRQRDKFGVSTREVDKIFTKVVHNHVKKGFFLNTLYIFFISLEALAVQQMITQALKTGW